LTNDYDLQVQMRQRNLVGFSKISKLLHQLKAALLSNYVLLTRTSNQAIYILPFRNLLLWPRSFLFIDPLAKHTRQDYALFS